MPQIYIRDPRLPIPSRVVAPSATELNLGVSGCFPTSHAKMNAKQMRSQSSRTMQPFLLACLHAQITLDAGNIRTS